MKQEFSLPPRSTERQMILGLALAALAALANFGLLFLSGWLLASAAVAGLAGLAARDAFNMFLPAAGARFLATARILARYGERVVTHDVTLRRIGQVRTGASRVWLRFLRNCWPDAGVVNSFFALSPTRSALEMSGLTSGCRVSRQSYAV